MFCVDSGLPPREAAVVLRTTEVCEEEEDTVLLLLFPPREMEFARLEVLLAPFKPDLLDAPVLPLVAV